MVNLTDSLSSDEFRGNTTMAVVSQNRTVSDLFPDGCWDAHHHIFDPAQYAYAPGRHLTPPPATIEQFLRFKKRLGITNSVLTHGLSYGANIESLKDFVQTLGPASTKGIGVIDPETVTPEELRDMHSAGIRGIRVNIYKYKAMHDVELQKVALREHARVIGKYCPGWSMAFTQTHPEFWKELQPVIEEEIAPVGIRLVTDHFALLKAPSMLGPECVRDVTRQPGFSDIIELVRKGVLYVKLSAPYRVSNDAPSYNDLKPLVRAYVEANPYRILWGSDWPHTPQMKVRTHQEAMRETPFLNVDDLSWLKTLRSWLSDEEWHAMMVTTPKVLYDW
ncbi:hypothetical protein BDV25DRAFT_161403 [Aspergillus avenaceus]|uniref:Amidohydrolase-related domain-containing protein n=1 Tax=Aspergillus avenaceus TaxID=36643 RepID=A0A5N6TKV5_ASPAV|nr:hypothetical protein BDV25DRAFT_161403 [Aspergillus avenaceus]